MALVINEQALARHLVSELMTNIPEIRENLSLALRNTTDSARDSYLNGIFSRFRLLLDDYTITGLIWGIIPFSLRFQRKEIKP
jgi:hypothetical protein